MKRFIKTCPLLFRTVFLLSILLPVTGYSQEGIEVPDEDVNTFTSERGYDLVQSPDSAQTPVPQSGTILLPDSLSPTEKEEKKCMTVCARWGEDCTYVNRGSAGMTRTCRRSCQQFTEECF